MKQKIVIEVAMHCGKCRTKALKIAAEAEGVTEVALHGAEKNKLQITGEGVDAVCLTKRLRKKLCYARLETVEEVKEEKKKEEKKEDKKEEKPAVYCYGQPQLQLIRLDPDPSPCTIL